MFLVLVTVDSHGLKTSLSIVEQLAKSLFAQTPNVSISGIVVPIGVSHQPAAINDRLFSIFNAIDVVIFFERIVNHTQLSAARHRILIPNPEWVTDQVAHLALNLTEMWHKTQISLRALAPSFPNLKHSYIGFSSRDFYGGSPDFGRFLHFRGSSPEKQTAIVLQAWQSHPEWPELRVQSYVTGDAFLHFSEWLEWKNLRFKYCKMSADEYRFEATQAGIHLCPSVVEGFGHYLNEARSMGALVVTTNGAPMNELVDETCGILIDPIRTEKQNFSTRYLIDVANFEKAIHRVLNLSIEARKALGDNARRRFLAERVRFQNQLISQLTRLTTT